MVHVTPHITMLPGMTDMRDILGKNLLFLRKQQGFTQEQLAELCDSTYVNISAIENARRWPSPDMIEKIAAALKVPAARLFFSPETLTIDLALTTVLDALGYIPTVHAKKNTQNG